MHKGYTSINSSRSYLYDSSPKTVKQILYLDELNQERKQNLEKLIKKNPKYRNIYCMIDRENYFSKINNGIGKRVFSERGSHSINEDFDIYKEKKRKRERDIKINELYNEIDNLQRNSSFDFYYDKNNNINNNINNQKLIDSINIKPQYGLPYKMYSTYIDNETIKILNNNIKQLKKNNRDINLKKNSFHSPQNKKLTDRDVKKWIIQEKFGLKEPFYIDKNGNITDISSFKVNDDIKKNNVTLKNKHNVKSPIYYSNDFFNRQLENFQYNLNKIGRNNIKNDLKRYKIRLFTP